MSEEREGQYGLVMSFWIDTDGYTARDREMFVCGVEFQMLYHLLTTNSAPLFRTIHTENSSRVRMMCAKLKRRCEIEATDYPEWVSVAIGAARTKAGF